MNGLWSNLSVIVGQPTSHPQTGSDTPRGRSKRRRQANMLCKSSQCSDQDLAPHAIPWLDGQKPTANGRATVATLSWNCVGTWICLVENLDQNTWTWILIDIPCYIMFRPYYTCSWNILSVDAPSCLRNGRHRNGCNCPTNSNASVCQWFVDVMTTVTEMDNDESADK